MADRSTSDLFKSWPSIHPSWWLNRIVMRWKIFAFRPKVVGWWPMRWSSVVATGNQIGQPPVFDAIFFLYQQQKNHENKLRPHTPTRPFRPDDGRDGWPLVCRGQDVGSFAFVTQKTKIPKISFTRIEWFNSNWIEVSCAFSKHSEPTKVWNWPSNATNYSANDRPAARWHWMDDFVDFLYGQQFRRFHFFPKCD